MQWQSWAATQGSGGGAPGPGVSLPPCLPASLPPLVSDTALGAVEL